MIASLANSVPGDAGLLSRLAEAGNTVKRQLDDALAQQASGKVSDVYSGLGAGLRISLDARSAASHVKTWQANIDAVAGRLEVSQSTLTQIAGIAQDFYAKTNEINDIDATGTASIAASAKLALQQVGQLLNTQDGAGRYVFAGQDTGNPPLPSTDPDVTGPALLASDTATAPFSATLGTAVPGVEIGENQVVSVGVLANRNTLAASAAPTTGSYMRDVMRALAGLAAMSDPATAPAAARDAHARLGSAIGALADESGALGSTQSNLATRKTTLAAIEVTMNKQVSNAEDVDMAATLTKVATLQTQLQSSYQVIAAVKGMSLASYL